MFALLTPDLKLESVVELDAPRLRSLGIEALLLDIDCTLKRYPEESVPPPVRDWLDALRQAGIALCLVSNGRGPRVRKLAAAIGLPVVCEACKPLPFGCAKAVKMLACDPAKTAMVGDQIFADVMAGRWAGLKCILVRPIHPEEERWFTRIKRPFERILWRRWNWNPPAS
jgi:HAD superfamily phosphatase (TIGR01668 family)